MAATKKSAKRSSAKKRASSKRGTKKATASKRRARKASKSSLPGIGAVRKVGRKTWKTLKSTTAQVVEGVKETFSG